MGGFRQHKFKYYLSAPWYEIDLRCIFCLRRHWMDLVNTWWYAFFVLASMEGEWSTLDNMLTFASIGWAWSIHAEMHFASLLEFTEFPQYMLRCILCPRWHGRGKVNTWLDAFLSSTVYVHAGIWGFGLQMLRCILCILWHRMGLINTSWDTICVLAGMGGVWSPHFAMHYLSSLIWEAFG